MTLGERIKTARNTAGISGNKLAQLCGTSQANIARLESGETTAPNVFLILAIAMVLGMTVEELVGEHEITPRYSTKTMKIEDHVAQLQQQVDDQLAQLQQQVDELAAQVERLSESQQKLPLKQKQKKGRDT